MITYPRDFSKHLRSQLVGGTTLDTALRDLRVLGASIIECIVATKKVRGCDLVEAKRLIHDSRAWADVTERTNAMWAELTEGTRQECRTRRFTEWRLRSALCSNSEATEGPPSVSQPSCSETTMSAPFEFTVTDTFLIEGRGLILCPFFPLDRYQFDGKEHVHVETPDGRQFEADADVETPHLRPTPNVFQAMFVLRSADKADVPVGSRVSLSVKSAEQVAAPTKNTPPGG